MRILVVDDQKMMLDIINELLTRSSYEPILASNGAEAVKVLAEQEIDILLTDLLMPRMNGFELISHVKKYHPNLPIIVMTGALVREIDANLTSRRMFPILRKPFEGKLLLEIINEEIRAKETGRLRKIGIAAFLQLLAMERQNTVLMVSKDEDKGFLFIRQGEVIDAKVGGLDGEEAARRIVGWNNVEISILDIYHEREEKIRSSLTKILMDSALDQDNRNK